MLDKRGFNIISGFGLGVGDSVIIGAMQALPRNDDERLQLWSFPLRLLGRSGRPSLTRTFTRPNVETSMRKLIVAEFISLDGVIQAPVALAKIRAKSDAPGDHSPSIPRVPRR